MTNTLDRPTSQPPRPVRRRRRGLLVPLEATCELTVHGATRVVTIPLQAQLVDGTVVIVGSVDIALADDGVSVPDAPIVVSASDTATLELQLFLQAS